MYIKDVIKNQFRKKVFDFNCQLNFAAGANNPPEAICDYNDKSVLFTDACKCNSNAITFYILINVLLSAYYIMVRSLN